MSIFNINNLSAALKTTPLQPALFQARFYSPRSYGGVDSSAVTILCQDAVLPGIGLEATGIKIHGYGNIERRPTDIQFQDFSASFILDGNGDVMSFFQNWINRIYKFDAANGLNQSNAGIKTYTFEYPENYEGTIEVSQYQVDESEKIQYKLSRAYPHSIGQLQVAYGAYDQIHILPIQFYYQSWSSNMLRQGQTYDVSSTYNMPSLDNSSAYADARSALPQAIQSVTPTPEPKLGQ